MLKITYLDHSGFAVTTNDAILVFDMFRDPSHALHKLMKEHPGFPVTFLVTHHHSDHFTTDIFNIAQDRQRTYVISNDVFTHNIPTTLRVAGMSPGDIIENIPGTSRIKAYSSTDIGVSYLATTTDGHTIFHAGDFNLWHWRAENTPQESRKAAEEFSKTLNSLSAEIKTIDIAMFPVDPRQGRNFAEGARLFTKAIRVRHFIPMHFWGRYKEACLFSAYIADPAHTHSYCLHTPGETINI